MRGCILVVDDQESSRQLLAGELEGAGYAVVEAEDGVEGWARFCSNQPDLVITDLSMPRCDGHDLLCRIRDRSSVPVIMMSANASLEQAVRALKAGASDFVSSERTDLTDLIGRAGKVFDERPAEREEGELEQRLAGSSDSIVRVRARISGLAPLAHPVLVLGEAGTGRHTVVRALHELGSTAEGALVRVDCSSWDSARGLPRASAVHLDEVDRLNVGAQAFWADVALGRGRVASQAVPRILASTSSCLDALGDAGFHPGLLAVLTRFPIELAPLRDRPDDIVQVADVLVRRLAGSMGRTARLSVSSRALLVGRRWPGNLKQLERLLERAIAFCPSGALEPSLLVELLDEFEDELGSLRRRRIQGEREALLDALRASGGNVTRASEILGRSRGAVYRLMEKHAVSRSPGR
jgi:DNA-binding NtrC family response regulator